MCTFIDQLMPRIETSLPILAASILAITAIAHGMTTWWLRRHRGDTDTVDTGRHAITGRWPRVIAELLPPLVALGWLQACYLALVLLTIHFVPSPHVAGTRAVLNWLNGAGTTAVAGWLGLRAGRCIEHLFVSRSRRTADTWDDAVLPLIGQLTRRALPLLIWLIGAAALAPTPAATHVLQRVTTLVLIAFVAWGLFRVVDAAASLMLQRHRIDVPDNLEARAIHTQIVVLKKVARAVIGVFTLASMLMVFDSARQFGASILASAGIAGIVVGLAAQRSIATLLAGFQIALTQPIRVDDVVIVENEWGRIEDITLTYVVVKLWDLRRLVVPIMYFIEHPFQNWTRTGSAMLGTVFLHVDYGAPIDALRAELTRILSASRYWDGAVNVLQVTDAKEHTLELRALASASDAGRAWDLRCEIREKLITFVQREYPASLPTFRVLPSRDLPPSAAESAPTPAEASR